jgi:hypothetical protein
LDLQIFRKEQGDLLKQEKLKDIDYKLTQKRYIKDRIGEQTFERSPMLFDNRIWLSTDEAAKYLGKTKNAIWILLSRGLLIKRKWRRRLYFKKTELDRLLETSLS